MRWLGPSAGFTMLARRQELNTQFHQLVDSFALAVSLFAAHLLRVASTDWFNLSYSIDPFVNYQLLLVVIMPFGPIILDLQGFYRSPLNKTLWKSFVQILRTMIYLSILVSGCVIFLRLPLTSRAVPLLFLVIATVVLLLKEQLLLARIRRRAAAGKLRERVLLAGVPQDIAALENSFTAEEALRLKIAGRIDIETRPISDLIEAMHKHAVARGIFRGGPQQTESGGGSDRRLRSGRSARLAGPKLHSNLNREAGFRCLWRPADARFPLDAGCVVGAAGEAVDRCVRIFLRDRGLGAPDDRGRDRGQAQFARAGDFSRSTALGNMGSPL